MVKIYAELTPFIKNLATGHYVIKSLKRNKTGSWMLSYMKNGLLAHVFADR
jgi:hypothetical protein